MRVGEGRVFGISLNLIILFIGCLTPRVVLALGRGKVLRRRNTSFFSSLQTERPFFEELFDSYFYEGWGGERTWKK